MPELPEIETVCRTLLPHVAGRRLEAVAVLHADAVKYPSVEQFIAGAAGHTISGLSRRGKYLLIHLDHGATLVAHLRMTGRLLCAPAAHERKPHTHLVFTLDNGYELRFSDTRRFGGFWLLKPGESDSVSGMQKLGPEPLDAGFHAQYLSDKLGKRRSAIKCGILDQRVIAGLGNIYADEALFAAGLHPARPCCSLSACEWQALADAIPPVLRAAIANNGTTFSDYLDGEGQEGRNMPLLKVYGRAGQSCRACGAKLQKTRIGGRGTSFCPSCQK